MRGDDDRGRVPDTGRRQTILFAALIAVVVAAFLVGLLVLSRIRGGPTAPDSPL